ncbi:MAG: hypothetical protein ACYDAG_13000 [Chloroflexota bacterium]
MAERRKVLITVRTYPTPSAKNIEVSCTAAITESGEWMRLFPVPYRFLDPDRRFKKYQWIEVDVTKARGDPRPESFRIEQDSIEIVGPMSTTDHWAERKKWVYPLKRHCMCCIQAERDAKGSPTLGLFKPGLITKLEFEPEDTPGWTDAEMAKLRQVPLFSQTPKAELEKIPLKFFYRFKCDHDDCSGHRMSCTDWEMAETYRDWKREYKAEWEAKFREKWERQMIERFDTHFFVGTLAAHPMNWIIVGVFYPTPEPPVVQPPLFS